MKLKIVLTISFCFAIAICCSAICPAQEPDVQTYTHVGQKMPQFTITDSDGKSFSIADLKGKVILINFWATWCGPCQTEMPRMEKEIWEKHKSDDLVMLAIAREEANAKIAPFREKNGFTFPIAGDPDRAIFKLFGNAIIPRSYVVGRDGTILFQSLGYNANAFERMKSAIETELKKTTSSRNGN